MDRAALNALSRLAEGLLRGQPLFSARGHLLSRQGGNGEEFHAFQAYRRGDDIRNIDWKASARSGHTLTRAHRQQAASLWYVLLDCSPSMRVAGPSGQTRWQVAQDAALAFAAILLNSGHRVGLFVFDEQVREQVPPRSGQLHLELIGARLRAMPAGDDGRQSSVMPVIDHLERPSSTVLISDFHWQDGVQAGVRACAGLGGEAHVLCLSSPADAMLPQRSSGIVLEDAETQERLVVEPPLDRVESRAQQALNDWQQELSATCSASGAVLTNGDVEKGWQALLVAHLNRVAASHA